jgi:hypothetical protein
VKEVAFPFQLPSWKSTKDWIASPTWSLPPKEEDICNWLQDFVALICFRKAGRDENADTTSLAHIVAKTKIIDICIEGKLEIRVILIVRSGVVCVRDNLQSNRHNKKELGSATTQYDSMHHHQEQDR